MATDDFPLLRSRLQQQRALHTELRQSLLLAREKRQRIEEAQARLERSFDEEDGAAQAERRRLEQQLQETARWIEETGRRAETVEGGLRGTAAAFARFSDPRQMIERLDDAFPILLLPLRLETRFREIAGRAGPRHQLWVRVYPDDCAVDTFEQSLSETEVRNARHYWEEVWRAGEDEQVLRAVWRNLAASHGSGRALWIVQEYQPLAGTEPPFRDEGDVVLVIGTSRPLHPAVAARAESFWETHWRAADDAAARNAARESLIADLDHTAAARIIEHHRPFNLDDEPPAGVSREEAVVRVLTVAFEPDDETLTRRRAWSRAPEVTVLPDRLVLIGYEGGSQIFEQVGNLIPSPLVVGPDPLAEPDDQIHQEGDEIVVGADMRWMVAFEEAVEKGMGFRIDLTPAQYTAGLDRLLVLGVRLSADQEVGREELERLLRAHHHSRGGLSLLRQGTPTNNTDDGDSAWAAPSDPDASFAILSSDGLFEPAPEWFARSDGQWLAEMLGIDVALLQRVDGAGHTDVREAQAMNTVLFPATIGYFMDTMLGPVFEDADVDFVRDFYTRFVSGRGMLSALRIGKQPYGILPATVYSRMTFPRAGGIRAPAGASPQLTRLHQVLMAAHGTWGGLLNRVAHVGKAGDPHQTLLEVLGLHAGSVEFDQRWAESLDQVMNRLNLQGWFEPLLERLRLSNQGADILAAHGHDVGTAGRPDILDKFFLRKPTPVNVGNMVHDLPVSEFEGLRAYTTDGRDYIEWLAEVAGGALDPVRRHAGFATPPTPLLYRLLRHAIILGYHDAAVRVTRTAQNLPDPAVRALRRDPTFVHVSAAPKTSESRYQILYQASTGVGGREGQNVAEHIASRLDVSFDTSRLREQIVALQQLKGLPSARLERLLVEHLDTCGYRLDAWLQGLVHVQLSQMRGFGPQAVAQKGVYLGAFGWLEDLRPSTRPLQPVRLTDPELLEAFVRDEDPPLMRDPTNQGYVHAPSPDHAVTAAVLRSGYRGTATPEQPGLLAVNLSSERVRRAMAVITGIRNGQSLGALLGYQLERGLHDRHAEAEVDRFIFKLRKAFPLVADAIKDTATPVDDAATDTDESIQSVEARNVIDGARLAEHIRKTGKRAYPFGKLWLPAGTLAQRRVIDSEVERLLDTHDAVADLGVAEGIHQLVRGNYDRAAASMEAFTSGELPPIPEVVQTPRSGIGLTHRVGLHLRSGLAPTASPVAMPITPRASAEPALNHWLADLLPPPDRVGVRVEWSDGTGASGDSTVTQADLGLQPLDLLYLLDAEGDQAMTALDDRILLHVLNGRRPDTEVRIRYTHRLAHPMVSLFEAGALIGELRPMLLGSRPLRSSDLALPNEVDPAGAPLPEYQPARLTHVADAITAAGGPLEALRTVADELEPLVDEVDLNRAALVAGLDDWIARFVTAAATLGTTGVTRGGVGAVLAWKRERYRALLATVHGLGGRWREMLDAFAAQVAEYDALPSETTDEARFEMLVEIEALVAVEATDPLPPTPGDYRTVLETRAGELATARDGVVAVLGTGTTSLATLLGEIGAAVTDLERFDTQRLELERDEAEIARYGEDLYALAQGMVDEADERIATAADALTEYVAAASALERETSFTTAAHALMGEDFLVVPEFWLRDRQAQELRNAFDGRAALLDHVTGTLGIDFPEDEWLYGVARVRAPMRRWEAATMLAGALSQRELALEPMQLPHRAGDSWMALPFPETLELDTDRLLYTAHFSSPFDTDVRQCGLMLDEWTEIIPATDETTGISFHYDRPNSEPPQVMLLATPPHLNGRWEWADLVDTLHETLQMAKSRAVEPDHLAGTSYARFVPATISAATRSPITIGLNYAVANDVYQFIPIRSFDA